MKKIVFLVAFITISLSLFAQVGENSFKTASWKLLDNAQRAYDESDIMTAIKLAENARQARSEEYTNAYTTMETALIPTAVQRRGDLIPDVRKVWEERKEAQAIAILDNALLLHTEEFFNNSITNVCNWYRSQVAYPEADYLLAKLYMLEGEYEIAKQFFDSALSNADVLDVKNERLSILYDYAYLDELSADYDGFEKNLQLIMEDNEDYIEYLMYNLRMTSSSYLSAIINATRNRGSQSDFTLDKFFSLYRSDYYDTISASIQLAVYYEEIDDVSSAYPISVLSVLTSFTRIYDILTSRNVKYSYSESFEGFLEEAKKYSDVQKWMKDNKVWDGFYVFGKLLLEYRKNEVMSANMFTALMNYCPESYIKNAAAAMLESMNQ